MSENEGATTSSESIQRFHANVVQAHGGPFDLTLDFGYRPNPATDPEFEARITMSWEHAVALAVILGKLIEQYESQVESLSALRAQTEAQTQVALHEGGEQ